MAVVILASKSPRRRELLAEAGYTFEVRPPRESAECGVSSGESAPQFVAQQAYQKAADVASRTDSGVVVGCDTVAECGGRILGKPADEADARRMLETLRGSDHRVWSGLCVWKVPGSRPDVRVAVTTLRMDWLSDDQIADYLASGGVEREGRRVRIPGSPRMGPRRGREQVQRGGAADGVAGRNALGHLSAHANGSPALSAVAGPYGNRLDKGFPGAPPAWLSLVSPQNRNSMIP